jgi:predicted metalloendopeptidase
MGEQTRAEALHKLSAFRVLVGYPTKGLDYASVSIAPNDLAGNVAALRVYHNDVDNRRVGASTDREEWQMQAWQPNAYHFAPFNEVVFPAAILQPPLFDPAADPAVNYGAIGAFIGHELGHGFDDQGSKSDYAGVLRNWWTDEDRARFNGKAAVLGAQYAKYCPIEGQCVNPALTMGENLGDLGGLSMAYKAYRLSLHGRPAPVIGGLTGDQRFFLAYAQMWRDKSRPEFLRDQLKSDSHSPAMYRINGAVRNMDAWYVAFDVGPGDKLYLPPSERVHMW